MGFQQPDDLIGKTDFDLKCMAANNAPEYQRIDAEIFKTKKDGQWLCFNGYSDGWKLLLGTYSLICHEIDNPLALAINVLDISSLSMLNVGVAFNEILFQKIQEKKGFHFKITDQYTDLDLTHRQSQVLFYYLHGYSAKKIAMILNISYKTVERHIENIKAYLLSMMVSMFSCLIHPLFHKADRAISLEPGEA